MDDFLNKGKEILKILISNGYEAYFIGDVVRQIILKQPYEEIEIATSATPAALKGIFEFTKVEDYPDEMVKLTYYSYEFYLSTFRVRDKKGRKAIQKGHYSKKLLDDLASRDFTINAIAMSHSEKLTDAYKGYEDIRRKQIRAIDKNHRNYDLSPVIMLRAIRLYAETRYNIQSSIKRSIRKNRKAIAKAPQELVIRELKKLFKAKYYKQALEELVSLGLYKYIPGLDLAFKYQNRRHYQAFTFDNFVLLAFIINKNINESLLPYVSDVQKTKEIFNLAILNPKCNYTNYDIFKNGLNNSLQANLFNVYLKKSKNKQKKINKIYRNMIIKTTDDLAFKLDEIAALTPAQDFEIAKTIQDKMVQLILQGEMANDSDVLKVFAINEYKNLDGSLFEEKVNYEYIADVKDGPLNPSLKKEISILDKELDYSRLEAARNEDEISETLKKQAQIIKDLTEHRLDMLERRLNEQDRLLREKDILYARLEKDTRERQIQEDIENLVRKNMEMLKDSDYLNNPQKDKSELSRQLHKAYVEYIKGIDNRYLKNE